MLFPDLDRASIQLLPSGIVHVTFEHGGQLTSQLLRELNVMSRLKTKALPAGYIFTVPDGENTTALHCGICKKAERIDVTIPVAVVCLRSGENHDPAYCSQFHKPQDTFQVFDKFDEAFSWVKRMLVNRIQSVDFKLQSVNLEKPPFTSGDLNGFSGLV